MRAAVLNSMPIFKCSRLVKTYSPLSFAIQFGSLGAVRQLLGSGGDLQIGNIMHCAVWRKPLDLDLVKFLVEQGAPCDNIAFQDNKSINLRGIFLMGTPLHEVCKGNVFPFIQGDELVLAQLLLDNHANPNKRQLRHGLEAGQTPLELARARGDSRLVWVLQSGLDPQL